MSGAPSPPQAESLQRDLNKMNQSWGEVTFLVEERQGQLERALSELKLWQVSDGCSIWWSLDKKGCLRVDLNQCYR